MRRSSWILALLIAFLGAACRGTLPGDRCETTADCDPPLVCSNLLADPDAGVKGICVLPEAIPDAAVTMDASATADAQVTQGDAAVIADAAAGDAATGDAAMTTDASVTQDASP